MKKEVFLFLAILIILYGCGAPASEVTEVQEKNIESENKTIVEEVIVNETVIEKKEELQIFEPVLKYPGSYNGPLYATSEQIGNYQNKEVYMNNLKRNGVNFMIGMFPILGKSSDETLASNINLGYVADLVLKYPGMIVPFFGSGFGGEELEPLVSNQGDVWLAMYTDVFDSYASFVGKDFIKGVGEVETQEWNIRYTDPTIFRLIELAEKNNKSFMFHPVASKLDDVKAMIEKYPNTNFLIHMYREDLSNGQQKLINIMKTHSNLYFSIDAAHIIYDDGNDILYSYHDEYGNSAKTKFISTVNSNYDSIIDSAVSAYRPLVLAVPDKIMWGTEAGPSYSFEPEVYDALIKVSRSFIEKVTSNSNQQEALAYKNALRVFGHGVTLKKEINVINADSWPFCKISDIDTLCGECGLGDENEELNPKAEACENECIIKLKCKDPLDSG